MAKEEWTPDSVPRVLMNPAYVLTDPSVVPGGEVDRGQRQVDW